jgi:hypothetical protein
MKTDSKKTQLNIKQFVQCVIEKNYAQADKYLQAAVEQKLAGHMKQAKTKNIFKQS